MFSYLEVLNGQNEHWVQRLILYEAVKIHQELYSSSSSSS
jgi:hypothetical protein